MENTSPCFYPPLPTRSLVEKKKRSADFRSPFLEAQIASLNAFAGDFNYTFLF